jgi:hypothetical protein
VQATCRETDCRGTSATYAACTNGECPGGKCCKESCSGTHVSGFCWKSTEEPSIFGVSGQSLFGGPIGLHTSPVSSISWQQVANELAEFQPTMCHSTADATNPQSCSIYLILDGNSSDYVIGAECKDESSVGSVLREAVLPHPVNFANAQIAVYRGRTLQDGSTLPGGETVLPVLWDPAAGEPTKCTNYALQPRDRLWVKPAASSDAAKNTINAAYAEATLPAPHGKDANQGTATVEDAATQILYNIQVIEDRRGCMSEFDALRHGAPVMYAETKTLLPAMRMLTKNQLIRKWSSPKLIAMAGDGAQLEVAESECRAAMQLEVSAEEFGDGLKVELAIHVEKDKQTFERRTELLLEPGQTIVLNATSPQSPEDVQQGNGSPIVYVVLTPEIVK